MPPTVPICPKCGYDQSGEVATWADRCPLQGQCPECGFTFTWANVFNPQRTHLPWYTEHAQSLRQLITRTPGTLIRLILPNMFWKRLPVIATFNLRALLLWFIFLSLTAHMLAGVAIVVKRWPIFTLRQSYLRGHGRSEGIYAYVEFACNSIFAPVFRMNIRMGPNGFDSLRCYFNGWESVTSKLLRPIYLSLGINLMWLAILLMIPTTRRIAKVRTTHVFRAFLLSMIATLFIFQLNRYMHQTYMYSSSYRYKILGSYTGLQFIVIWQLVFWPAAIIHGWKVRPAKVLIALGTVAAGLFGLVLALTIFIFPDLIS